MVLETPDSVIFPTGITPKSVKRSIQLFKAVSQSDLKKILLIVQCHLLRKEIPNLSDLSVQYNTITEIYEGIEDLYSAICRLPKSKLTIQILRNELKALHIEDSMIDVIVDFFITEDNISIMRSSDIPVSNQLSNCKWRIDVAISTSSLQRSLQPSIMMELTLTNGEKHVFEMSVEKFNHLRFNVAGILKNLLENETKVSSRV